MALKALLNWIDNLLSGAYGPALSTLLVILFSLCTLSFPFVYRRYLGILAASAKRKGTLERPYYDALRDSLTHGNIAERIYASRLTAFLHRIDHFFGDAGGAHRTLFPRAFGLETPAALWTAPAFDRCLLLALVYPVATIFLIWAVSGHVGPAEAALRLGADLSGAKRVLVTAAAGISFVAVRLFFRSTGWRSAIAFLSFMAALATMSAVVGEVNAMPIFLTTMTAGVLGNIPLESQREPLGTLIVAQLVFALVGITVGIAAGTGLIEMNLGKGFSVVIAVIISVCFFVPISFMYNKTSILNLTEGFLLSVMFALTTIVCLVAATLLPGWRGWEISGPLIFFFGLLTLINTPFDWASLGLTRALLRRGLELKAWWPYLLALVDAALAAIIIAALALMMVLGAQTFDALVVYGGGKAILPLQPFFDGIAADPTAPEFWWVYALLLSTMLPSLVNLMIGGASLLRGIPGLPSLLLRFMPEGKAVPSFDRAWIALILTLQIYLGAALGILAQAFLVIVVIIYIMPPFGLGLLDMAREVAAFNLPLRIGQLFPRIF